MVFDRSRESQARRRERNRRAYNKYIRLHRKARFHKYPILRVRHAFRNDSQARLRNLGITGIPPIDELVGGWENVVKHFEPMLADALGLKRQGVWPLM
jgi:hypothetical protein